MTDSGKQRQAPRSAGGDRRHGATALVLAGFAVAMLGLSFAAVPLYRTFCQVTGYGGTTQRAQAPAGRVIERRVTVRFDANVARALPWAFKPRQREITLRLGESALVYYEAKSNAPKRTAGSATFNVTPEVAGRYFNKIQCFCFSEQTLEPGVEVELPLTFFVDPEMANDPELAHVNEITLSYTFFPVEEEHGGVAEHGRRRRAGT